MTTVEWLVGQLKEYNHLSYDEQSWIFEQAKEMEKQQIIDAVYESLKDESRYCGDYNSAMRDGIDYYNETFKNTNK